MFQVEINGIKVLYTGDYSREPDRHLMHACFRWRSMGSKYCTRETTRESRTAILCMHVSGGDQWDQSIVHGRLLARAGPPSYACMFQVEINGIKVLYTGDYSR